jgi:uncharacterized membrane protein YqgA involved in biofilm formation
MPKEILAIRLLCRYSICIVQKKQKGREPRMVGMGTLVNTAAVLAGGGIGLVLKHGLRPQLQKTIMQAMGMATIFIGVSGTLQQMLKVTDGALEVNGTMLLILSLIIGGIIGALVQIERRMEQMGEWLKSRVHAKEGDGRFVEGFVTASLVICVGAMAVVGSLQDGMSGDASTLYAKSALDFMIVMVFAATLGAGVLFSAVPLFLYQGGITLGASFLAPFLQQTTVIADLSLVGNVLIFGIGVNIAFEKDLHVGNMLPALLVPVVWHWLF